MSAPPIRAAFARRLKALRGPRGFATARSFAQALEIDENRYTRYERAEVEPDLTLITRICAVLGITPNELLEGHDPPPVVTPGFGESATQPLHPGRGDGIATPHGSPRQALAWQLAEEIAKIGADQASGTYNLWSLTVKAFGEIDADPYGFMQHLQTSSRLDALDPPTAGRIAEIAAAFMKHLSADILNAPPPGSIA